MEKSQKNVKVRDRLDPIKQIPQAINFQNFINKSLLSQSLGERLLRKKAPINL